MPQAFVITGNVEFASNEELLEGRVEAYDRDLPSLEQRGATPQLLGQSPIDANFRFRIEFTDEQFRRGEGETSFLRRAAKIRPDLTFQVFDATGRELKIARIVAQEREYRPDQIIFNAPSNLEEVEITVEPPPAVGDSEYERLVAAIAPVLGDLPIAELTDEDIQFLVNELELEQSPEEQNQIKWLRYSALLERETNLSIEAFYGWGREDLPATFVELAGLLLENLPKDLPSVLKKLSSLEVEELSQSLLKAIEKKIIPTGLRNQIDTIIRQLKRRNQVLRKVVAQLKDAETDRVLVGYTVTTFDRTEGGENLGLDISDNEGKFFFSFYVSNDLPQDAPARKFAFKVQPFEGEEIPESEPVDINPNQPETEIITIKVNVPKPPTPALQEQFQQVQIDAPELLTYFSDRNIKTFTDIRLNGGINRLPDLPEIAPEMKQKLKALVDLDRLSLKVMASTALIEKQYDSVLAIADSPRSEFVDTVKDSHEDLTELEATKLHIMASAQTDFLNNLLVEMATNQANGFTL